VTRSERGDGVVLPIELAHERVDFGATGKAGDMLLKQTFVDAYPARGPPAVLAPLDAVGDGHGIGIAVQKFGDVLQVDGATAFVTSSGTLDKADATAREHIATMADLVGALRLPSSFRAEAGTDVIVDILFFRKRQEEETAGDDAWLDLAEIRAATEDEGAIRVNRYFAEHPDMVLGEHALRGGIYGPDETYTCLPRTGADLGEALAAAILHLPESVYDGEPEAVGPDDAEPAIRPERGEHGSSVREGSYFIGANGALMQMVDGTAVTIKIKKGRSADGIFEKHARIIRKLIPIRDAVREILKCQEADQPWKQPQVRLRIAWSSFVRDFGPINTTVVSSVEDEETGEVRETHRRTNLAPFADDPDCWLVASIEDDDLESNSAKPGAIFTERVIAPPPAPVITSAIDAFAVVLNERARPPGFRRSIAFTIK
jgi:hypothetical protein